MRKDLRAANQAKETAETAVTEAKQAQSAAEKFGPNAEKWNKVAAVLKDEEKNNPDEAIKILRVQANIVDKLQAELTDSDDKDLETVFKKWKEQVATIGDLKEQVATIADFEDKSREGRPIGRGGGCATSGY